MNTKLPINLAFLLSFLLAQTAFGQRRIQYQYLQLRSYSVDMDEVDVAEFSPAWHGTSVVKIDSTRYLKFLVKRNARFRAVFAPDELIGVGFTVNRESPNSPMIVDRDGKIVAEPEAQRLRELSDKYDKESQQLNDEWEQQKTTRGNHIQARKDRLMQALNDVGKEGWEVVQLLNLGEGQTLYLLRKVN